MSYTEYNHPHEHMPSFFTQSLLIILFIMTISETSAANIPSSVRSNNAIESVKEKLTSELSDMGLGYGKPIFIRIFKESEELELWVKSNATYKHFKTYPICTFSGGLGPKTKEGDKQAPEGFYFVKANNLNPWSKYHLSFNLGYPNAYDRFHGYTGSALMVHGKCVSIGCYAMTDKYINEIYSLAHAALSNGQAYFRVHIFPFRFTENTLDKHKETKWHSFWENLEEGYRYFENNKVPPNVTVNEGKYVFGRGD